MQSKGKSICNILKEIRKQIADANDIEFTPSVCHHQGECSGTCPMCESEKSFIEQQISLKQKAGQAIKIVGIASSLVAMAAQPLSAQTPEALAEDAVMNWDLHFFDFNGNVKPEYETQSEELAEFVKANPNEIYIVVGHTDERGRESYNLKLSQKRSEYMVDLIRRRCENEKLVLVPVGAAAYEPRIRNAQDEAEHEQNRRATIETYKYGQHTGKVGALVEFGLCQALGVTVPHKVEKALKALNAQPYDAATMKAEYDNIARKIHGLIKSKGLVP